MDWKFKSPNLARVFSSLSGTDHGVLDGQEVLDAAN